MKSNSRRGHSEKCRGAKGILDEVDVCTVVHNVVKKDLQTLGMYGVDCTSSEKTVSGDLAYGVNKNNSNKADYFVSIHANVTKGGYGSEIWLHPNTSQENKDKANAVLKELEKLGFKNRGIKYMSLEPGKGLYELKNTNNKAQIIELFFLDSEKDVALYKKLGAEKIGHAITKGLTGKTIQEKKKTYKIVCTGMSKERAEEAAERLRKEPRAFKCRVEEE